VRRRSQKTLPSIRSAGALIADRLPPDGKLNPGVDDGVLLAWFCWTADRRQAPRVKRRESP